MSHKNTTDPCGEPEPVPPSEALRVLKGAGTVTAVAAAGLIVFTSLSTVGRTAGATRSATLQWQKRQAEIQEVILASNAEKHGPDSAGGEGAPGLPD